jgi:Cu/Ag efflux protein CusF
MLRLPYCMALQQGRRKRRHAGAAPLRTRRSDMKTTYLAAAALLCAALGAGVAAAQPRGGTGSDGARVPGPAEEVHRAQGIGTVRAVDADGRHVTIAHEAIPEMVWPAIADHRLSVSSRELLRGIRPGQRVRFTLTDAGIIVVLDVLP